MARFRLNIRSEEDDATAPPSSSATITAAGHHLFSLTLIYRRDFRDLKRTVQINFNLTFLDLKAIAAAKFNIVSVSDVRLCKPSGSGMKRRLQEIKARDDQRILMALNDGDTVIVEERGRRSPKRERGNIGSGSSRRSQGHGRDLVPALTGLGDKHRVVVHQIPAGGRVDEVETIVLEGDEIPPEYRRQLRHAHTGYGDLRDTSGGSFTTARSDRRADEETDKAIALSLQDQLDQEQYLGMAQGLRKRFSDSVSGFLNPNTISSQDWPRRSPPRDSSLQDWPRRSSTRPLRRKAETKIVPDPGVVVLRGTTSQYTLSPGGESACTSICLFAARELLSPSLNKANSNPSQGLGSLGTDDLDFVVQCGINAHQSLDSMHASVDELWSRSAFDSVASQLEHGAPFGGMVNSMENGFKQALRGALEFARSQQQSSSSSPSAASKRVAVVITKPPETILCVASSYNGEGGNWYIFDSHGESNAARKLVYIKRYDSINGVAQGLMHKFPGACVADMGGGLQAEMYNSFEATPIIYQPGGGRAKGARSIGQGMTSMERAMEASRIESSRNAASRSTRASSRSDETGDLERALEESKQQQQQQRYQEIVSKPPRGDELERAMEESKSEGVSGANLRIQSAPARSSHTRGINESEMKESLSDSNKYQADSYSSPSGAISPVRSLSAGQEEVGSYNVKRKMGDYHDKQKVGDYGDERKIGNQCGKIGNNESQDGRLSAKATIAGKYKDRTEPRCNEKPNGKRHSTKTFSYDGHRDDGCHTDRSKFSGDKNEDDDEFEENQNKYFREENHHAKHLAKKPSASDESHCTQDAHCLARKKPGRDGADQVCAPLKSDAKGEFSERAPAQSSSNACRSDSSPPKGKILGRGSFKLAKEMKTLSFKSMGNKSKKKEKQPEETSATSAPPITKPETESKSRKEPTKDSFLDPMLLHVMADPVICDDGFTYDRPTIEQHFRTRIEQEEARQREEEGGQSSADDAACCVTRRKIQLTSPKTGQVISDRLVPNHDMELHIVELIKEGKLDMTEGNIADWKKRREEKLKNDHRRREVERKERERIEEKRKKREAAERLHREEANTAQGGGQAAVSAAPPEAKQRPWADQVKVDRIICHDKDKLSEHDLGISVALCHDNERCCSPEYASSVGAGNVPRCMVACCAKRLTSDHHWCARCGRLACSDCLEFHVTDYASRSTQTHSICGECVTQIVDVMNPRGTSGQVRAIIINGSLRRHMSELTDRAIELQDQRVKLNAETQFGSGIHHLENEVKGLEQTSNQLQARIRDAEIRAKNARNNGSSASNSALGRGGITGESIAELEQTCADLRRQHIWLEGREVPYSEEAQMERFTAISEIESRLELAQMKLSEMQSEFANSSQISPENCGSVEEWKEIRDRLRIEYADLTRTRVPEDEFSQIRYIKRISEVTARLEEADMKLSELRSDNNSATGADSNDFSVDGKSAPELEEMLVSLQREYDDMLSQPMPEHEASQFARIEDISLMSSRLETLQISLVEARTKEESSNAINQGRDSSQIEMDDPVLLGAIGLRDNKWPLPLGLSYPTTRMEKQLELLKNTLAQELSIAERKYDDEYTERRRRLTETRDRLEDEIEQARAMAQDAEASAELVQNRLRERKERRRREEEERFEREGVRRAREIR
mmetsp:Transcript_22995/g.33402  ORF Transcript_22995/g.33402 Transcript_22995/m.33402 type:complete len:1657 (-) Transcript_22995:376-5346(-)